MKTWRTAVFPTLLLLSELAGAVHLPLQGRRRSVESRSLRRRASVTGTSTLNDINDISYQTNITMGGQQFAVVIDTGSSDLYIAADVPNSQSTGKNASVLYASGEATGPVLTADLEFAGFTVPNQAFILAPASEAQSGSQGLIGLGPVDGSQIDLALQNVGNGSIGDTPLNRLFALDTSTPNFISFLLGRVEDPLDDQPGNLTIGEIIPGYEAISNQPKLAVTNVPNNSVELQQQHWQVLLDENGFIAPNGSAIPLTTNVSSTQNKGQLTVVFDTGFSLPQVPQYISDAIYGNIPGAKFGNNVFIGGDAWTVPCAQEINISFVFGGQRIQVHPLDVVLDFDLGADECIGAFQPVSFSQGGDQATFDIVFGMAFLRNVYMLINMGDFVDDGLSQAAPFVQMLSITNDTSQINAEFNAARAADTKTTHRHEIILAAVLGGVGLILLGLCGLCCCCGRRILNRRKARSAGRYQPLANPAPQQDMQLAPPQAPYDYQPPLGPPRYDVPPAPGQYQTPWEQRQG